MDIISVFGGIKTYHRDLLMVSNLVNSTMGELGITPKEINLGPPTTIPFFYGIKSQIATEFIDSIRASAGVIFATSATSTGVNSVLSIFLEHLQEEPDILKDKNCMLIILSDTKDTSVMDSFARTINQLGGFDSVRIFLDHGFLSGDNSEIVEKQVEDFYRMVRQKRKFYVPKMATNTGVREEIRVYEPVQVQAPTIQPMQQQVYQEPVYQPVAYQEPVQMQQVQNQPVQSQSAQQQVYQQPAISHQGGAVYTPSGQYPQGGQVQQQMGQMPTYQSQSQSQPQPYNNTQNDMGHMGGAGLGDRPIPPKPAQTQNHQMQSNNNIGDILSSFTQKQNDDIQEISSFFSRKQPQQETYTHTSPQQGINPLMSNMTNVTGGQKTIRQLTASLIHHYQPQVAGDLSCVIQINIDGANGFVGHIVINAMDCFYYDGEAQDPTLTVLSDETSWTGVVTGKVSAQKAFMTGSLKIKGNFVLLTRFDQIFNTDKNR